MVLNPILETVANCWFESSSDYKKTNNGSGKIEG